MTTISNPTPAAPAAPLAKARAGSIVVPKMADPGSNTGMEGVQGLGQQQTLSQQQQQQQTGNPESDSERQLVSSLAKLQKLETMIQNMRTLLPDRLLEPIIPIVNPRVIAQGKTMPKSPQVLYERLSKTAKEGVSEVSNFRTMWTSPELKEVWDHVDARVRENNGQLLQPTGTWERDYDVLLETLVKDEQAKKDEQERSAEETGRTQSAEGNWRTVVEGFAQKNVPGVRVAPSRSRDAVTVTLAKAGMAFDLRLGRSDGSWTVSNKPSMLSPDKPTTKLETAICASLNTRPRQWDLAFLLDMITSYLTIKQTPCAKCTKMTDNTAQLPTIRRPKFEPGQTTYTFEPYHLGCTPEHT